MDFRYSPEVLSALRNHLPIVALESTIVSHGMPYPANLATALEVEAMVRGNGAVPATIAILSGKVHIGLSPQDLETLAKLGQTCVKCSRRNLPVVLAKGQSGSTTVAATMYLAWKAGIKVFVTGGIGGVHRGAEETWDVSADLIELGRVPIMVICAGAKSILDIPKTLEYLETQGVPVLGYQTQDFPAFFVPTSGCFAMSSVNSPTECAQILFQNERLSLNNGILVGVPVPKGQEAHEVEGAITQALSDMAAQHITGSKVTPYLLARVAELTEGDSLRASNLYSDICLIKHNAEIGAQIAVAYAKRWVLVIGGVARDFQSKCEGDWKQGTSMIGKSNSQWGGVGRNIATAARLVGAEVKFVTAVGKDQTGTAALGHLQALGIVIFMQETNNCVAFADACTASYVQISDSTGNLQAGIAAMDVNTLFQPEHLHANDFASAAYVVLDANFPPETLRAIVRMAKEADCKGAFYVVILDPTSYAKAEKCLDVLGQVWMVTPDRHEVMKMATEEGMEGVQRAAESLLQQYAGLEYVLCKMDVDGVMLVSRAGQEHFPALPVPSIANVSGAGDCLVGALASALTKGKSLTEAIQIGLQAAAFSVQSYETVPESLRSL
jgi:pseudouridine-5'-phosphate glycosidase/pseudouridine kinase